MTENEFNDGLLNNEDCWLMFCKIVFKKDVSKDETIKNPSFTKKLFEAMSKLTEREKEIICSRYGLLSGKPKTLEAIGNAFGYIRERVRQFEAHAIREIRENLGITLE